METEVPGDTTGTLRHFLLNAAIGDKCVSLMRHDLTEASSEESLSDGTTDGHGMTLSERSGRVFNAAIYIEFRVTRSYTTPLAETLKILYREIPGEGQHGI